MNVKMIGYRVFRSESTSAVTKCWWEINILHPWLRLNCRSCSYLRQYKSSVAQLMCHLAVACNWCWRGVFAQRAHDQTILQCKTFTFTEKRTSINISFLIRNLLNGYGGPSLPDNDRWFHPNYVWLSYLHCHRTYELIISFGGPRPS